MPQDDHSAEQNAEDLNSDGKIGGAHSENIEATGQKNVGTAPQCDCEDVSKGESDAQIMRIKSRAHNCRMMMGCGLFAFLIFVVCAAFVLRAPFDAAAKFADAGRAGAGCALKEIKDFINRKPDAVVFGESSYQWTRAANKYIVAEVRERVSRKAEYSKYKILTGNALIEVDAVYQYYIPLRGLKYRAEAGENGKLNLTFYFDSLKPDIPVKYEEVRRDVAQSKFSDDVNAEISQFQKTAFPKILAEHARSQPMVLAAREEAENAMRETLKKTFIPASGISDAEVGKIDIIFNTEKFDNFEVIVSDKAEADKK